MISKIWTICINSCPSHRAQLTILYCLSFGALGYVISCLGPYLPELSARLNRSHDQMGIIVTLRAIGYLSGSFLGSLFDQYPGHWIIGSSLALCSLSCFFITFVGQFWQLPIIIPLQGFSMGILDSGANILILAIHQIHFNTYLQILHFSFALGGLIPPLLTHFFLHHTIHAVDWCWHLIAALFIPMSILFFISKTPDNKHFVADGHNDNNYETIQTPSSHHSIWPTLVIVCTCTVLFFGVGSEISMSNLLTSYTQFKHHQSLQTAALINAIFWLMMTLGRLLAIPISIYMNPMSMMLISCGLSVLSTLILVIWSQLLDILWVGVVIYGLALSVIFPTAISLAESMLVISGKVATCFVVGAALGEILIPLSVSSLFTTTKYMSMLYIPLFSSILQLALILAIGQIQKKIVKFTPKSQPEIEIDLFDYDDDYPYEKKIL